MNRLSNRWPAAQPFAWLLRWLWLAMAALMIGAVASAPASAAGLGLRSMQDLAQRRVAVFSGTSQDLFISAKYPQANIVRFNSQADFVLALKTRRVDAAILDLVVARVILDGNPELALLANDFYNTDISAAVRPNDTALLAEFNRFVAAARQDGTLADIDRRWMQSDPEKATMPKIEVPRTGPPLRVGTSLILGLPFVAQRDGQFIGQEIELAQRFAVHSGRALEIVPLEFDALIAALAVGKIDIIIASLSVTEERKRSVAFSTAYATEASAALVHREDLHPERLAATRAASAPVAPSSTAGLWASLRSSLEANFLAEARWKLVLSGLWTTLLISLASTVLGTLLGAGVCWARMSSLQAARAGARLYIGLVRGMPVLLLLMLIFYVIFAKIDIDPALVAVIAFAINFSAYVAEMFRSGVEGVERGQFEAGVAMGFTPLQTFSHIVLPQAVRRILPVYRGEFISLVKMTSIVGYIGVQDLTKASDIIRSRTFEAFFPLIMVAVLYFGVIWLLGLALDAVDRRTDPQRQRKRAMA